MKEPKFQCKNCVREMCKMWSILLAAILATLSCGQALHEFTYEIKASSNDSKALTSVEDAEAVIVEAHSLPTPITAVTPTPPQRRRSARQLFYEPNLIFISSVGVSAVAEGGRCATLRGLAGSCVRIGQCGEFYKHRHNYPSGYDFFTSQKQWALPPLHQAGGVLPWETNELCTFYDQYGRINNGVCCTDDSGGGGGGFGAWPIPAPPTAVTPPTPPGEGEVELIEPTVVNDGVAQQRPAVDDVVELQDELEQDSAPEFPDDNNIIYDPIKEFEDASSTPGTPLPYDDVRYQWPPPGFGGHFGAAGVPQWPPPVPTHPPAAASWPPPIPTHPPGHHYPTHPPSLTRPTTQPTKRPPSSIVTTTRRPATSVTTTRRPTYPAYPTYPTYKPTYRPTTVPTITTTRRPSTPTISSGGTSANGLPLQCGVKNPTSPDQERIVGGSNASPYEFPWIAVLFRAGKQFCGGSLITHNHVLTAAHCVARMTSWDVAALTVHLGDYNIRTDFEVKHVERRVKRLVRHKGFDFSHLHNDIAILTLNEPVKFTYEIQPLCLPTSTAQQSRSYSGQLATVAGWGSLRENGPQPSVLQKVQLPIWSNPECARKYGRAAPGGIIESMVCAGTLSKDSCSGDSGGPLIVRDEGSRYTQVGIVSWGIGCGKGQYPGVYTRVTTLLPWIYKNIKM